jgi:hypothetical protein
MPALPLRTLCLCVKLYPPCLATRGCTIFVRQPVTSVSPFFATLTRHPQPADNKTTLSALSATLTSYVKPKSFVCHSYKKHGGVGEDAPFLARHSSSPAASAAHSNTRLLRAPSARGNPSHTNTCNSNPFMRLLHDSLDTRGGAVCPAPSPRRFRIQPSTFTFQHSTLSTSHHSAVTSHFQ